MWVTRDIITIGGKGAGGPSFFFFLLRSFFSCLRFSFSLPSFTRDNGETGQE